MTLKTKEYIESKHIKHRNKANANIFRALLAMFTPAAFQGTAFQGWQQGNVCWFVVPGMVAAPSSLPSRPRLVPPPGPRLVPPPERAGSPAASSVHQLQAKPKGRPVPSCAPPEPAKRPPPATPYGFSGPLPASVHNESDRQVPRHLIEVKREQSSESEPLEPDSGMESGWFSGNECEGQDSQWAKLLKKWEDKKTKKMEELVPSETACRSVSETWDDDEAIREEQENEREELIKRTRQVLARYRGSREPSPVQRAGQKRGRSPPPKRTRREHTRKADSKYADLDNQKELTKVDIGELRFSQLTIGERFQCGRRVSALVHELLNGEVGLSAPFLRLTVFETTDKKTKAPILRCIDNRRLYALKQYAWKARKKHMMVNVTLFSYNTLMQCQRFINNSDDTDGLGVRMRTQGSFYKALKIKTWLEFRFALRSQSDHAWGCSGRLWLPTSKNTLVYAIRYVFSSRAQPEGSTIS